MVMFLEYGTALPYNGGPMIYVSKIVIPEFNRI